MRQKNKSEIPFSNILCLIKIHTLVEIPSWPGRWELPIPSPSVCAVWTRGRRENTTLVQVHTLSNPIHLKTFLPVWHEVSPETDPVNGTLPESPLIGHTWPPVRREGGFGGTLPCSPWVCWAFFPLPCSPWVCWALFPLPCSPWGMLGVFPIAPFGFHAQHVYNLIMESSPCLLHNLWLSNRKKNLFNKNLSPPIRNLQAPDRVDVVGAFVEQKR